MYLSRNKSKTSRNTAAGGSGLGKWRLGRAELLQWQRTLDLHCIIVVTAVMPAIKLLGAMFPVRGVPDVDQRDDASPKRLPPMDSAVQGHMGPDSQIPS
jgi:hypothetical protein